MHLSGADSVLVRHGDVGVKSSQVQATMEGALRENVESLLADRGIEGTVEREWGRLIIRTPEPAAATDAASDAFGVVSASPARTVDASMDAIRDALADAAASHYPGGSFAVEARRTGGQDFTSQDVGREGGEAVWQAVEDDFAPEVNLDDPDTTFYVEVRDAEAFVFLEKREGPGGLPLGTQAPVVALVSGGIDSPVAAWLAMKRGSPIVPVYLDLGDYGGPDHRARALETVRTLRQYAPGRDMAVRVVPAGPAVDRLGADVGRTRMLSYRRFMYRVAEHVAEAEGAVGVVTGEAIGQKSSQTATNIRTVDAATDLPVHRPLLALDKQEIIAKAREIGTYRDATIDVGCNRLAPSKPATRASLDAVRRAEPDDLFDLARAAAESVETVPVGDLAVPAEGLA